MSSPRHSSTLIRLVLGFFARCKSLICNADIHAGSDGFDFIGIPDEGVKPEDYKAMLDTLHEKGRC
ncbi:MULTISPECIES: hypothetical protein [unclassified Oceanispirochaeta]|uniref:hypothetical protein n=1 Tax=unclassified Oceanispirochaeta TaxID=2635722 RepID=UPI0011C05F04|nr:MULTISPECIES: hypothetical protein [unclassified Oceanispirochaeta]MBF9015863.1 hypothetical protein [Oceanispirochaeta sp. M2]NPD72326.1 hypothetical protein [Oceanispirochaeta sp. M1]